MGRDYVIAAINDAARRLLSIPGVAVGEDFLHVMQEVPYAKIRRIIDEALRKGKTTQTGEFVVEASPTGEPSYLRLTCHAQPTGDEARRAENVLVVVEDVTAAVRMRRLAEKNLRLEETNRELGLFVERRRAERERERLRYYRVGARAEAAERERLSRELHDRVAHSMGIVHQSLQLYEILYKKIPNGRKTSCAWRRGWRGVR